jgi:hypothetical protein
VGLASPGLEAIAATFGFGNQALPAWVGFLAFVGVAYLIHRTALKAGGAEPSAPVIEKM